MRSDYQMHIIPNSDQVRIITESSTGRYRLVCSADAGNDGALVQC